MATPRPNDTQPIRLIGAAPGAVDARVAIIRPGRLFSKNVLYMTVTAPVGPAYIAASLRESGCRVQAIDALGEGLERVIDWDDVHVRQGLDPDEVARRVEPGTQMIGVSCLFTQDWPHVREIIAALRARHPEALIVIGGEHVTAAPEFCLKDAPGADLCVLGEGEETAVEIAAHLGDREKLQRVAGVAYLEDGNLVRTPPRPRIGDVDAIPRPAWDLFPMEIYLSSRTPMGLYQGRSMAVLGTRGCPYECTFCSNPQMYGRRWLARDPGLLLDEIEDYIDRYGAQNFDFYDLTMVLKRDWILEFCRQIEERGLRFTYQFPSGTRTEVLDDEVSAALYRTGCRHIAYSPESGSPSMLRKIKKRVDLDKLTRSARAAIRNGIQVKCNIIIGYPHETRRELMDTLRFVARLAWVGVDVTDLIVFTPYPGSELHDELVADGTIGEFDDEYFRTMAIFVDKTMMTPYCKAMSGRELFFWRLVGMGIFYAVSFGRRPRVAWHLVRRLLGHGESRTILETRLSELVSTRRTVSSRRIAAPDATPPR